MSCINTPYQQLWEQFIDYCTFNGAGWYVLQPEAPNNKIQCLTTGYVVNKDYPEILRCSFPTHSFQYHVFDHIRTIEEVFSGLYITNNKEFNHIFPIFIREFMLGSIYIIYSKEFRDYELQLAAKLASNDKQDPFERLEKSYPDSCYRLLRRVSDEKNKNNWRWDAILSGVQDIKIDEFLPIIDENPKHPIRCSFNDGFLFIRLYEIFAHYESQRQTYKRLFNALHKVGDITGEDISSIQNKELQFHSAGVFTYTPMTEKSSTVVVEDLKLIERIKALHDSYDIIQTDLNDALGKLGLAGDDSTKAERITTGENFRALQPNMSYQQTIQHRLDIISERLKTHFNQSVTFINTLKPNEQGIPVPNINDKESNKSE